MLPLSSDDESFKTGSSFQNSKLDDYNVRLALFFIYFRPASFLVFASSPLPCLIGHFIFLSILPISFFTSSALFCLAPFFFKLANSSSLYGVIVINAVFPEFFFVEFFMYRNGTDFRRRYQNFSNIVYKTLWMARKCLLRTAVNAVVFLLFSQVMGFFHFHVVLLSPRKKNIMEDFQYFPVLALSSDIVSDLVLE